MAFSSWHSNSGGLGGDLWPQFLGKISPMNRDDDSEFNAYFSLEKAAIDWGAGAGTRRSLRLAQVLQ